MDKRKYLILDKGVDKTADIISCKYDSSNRKYQIRFKNERTYNYNYENIEWIQNPVVIKPEFTKISYKGEKLYNIREIYVFCLDRAEYWRVYFSDNSDRLYERNELQIKNSCLMNKVALETKNYLGELAAINELKSDDGKGLLAIQYNKLDFVAEESAMALYLDQNKYKVKTYKQKELIFPFGGNASQFKAVANALNSQLSVIQGPPGTGKTQTILNIIANLLIHNKTVQVVSNNNLATMNILEKLAMPQYNMDFIVAYLGSAHNKEEFIKNQKEFYPDISDWEIEQETQIKLLSRINELSALLNDAFAKQERVAQAKTELDALNVEGKYFEECIQESKRELLDIKFKKNIKPEKIMQLWQQCSLFSEKNSSVSLWFKLKSTFLYGIANWRFYDNDLATIIMYLQHIYLSIRKLNLITELESLQKYLETTDAKGNLEELTSISMQYLRAKLFEQYGNKHKREKFDGNIWRRPENFMQEYPIILSTTFSSRSCLPNTMYDYVIMDEASQVDIATGALALSCARNAVIVGDLKQLPNVVKSDLAKKSIGIFKKYNLPQGYSFAENSFLKSISEIHKEAPSVLLREHYRCHPKIIEFCNKKFYNSELIIMTENNNESDTLSAIKTKVGNHAADGFNQRQIDVIKQEVLPRLSQDELANTGIIAPYNAQVDGIRKQICTDKIEVRTVHKFQGREKESIVLSTVDDRKNDFSDDPILLNVAVSRAKKRLCLVTSGNEYAGDSNIRDLVDYIQYNNFQVEQSEVYSIFDLLYKQYTKARIEFLKKHPKKSEYGSENIMYANILEVLNGMQNCSLDVICHQPLYLLIRDRQKLDEKELKFVVNKAAHVDFLIYNRFSKKPILAIEVDGFRYHKAGSVQYERDRMKDNILTKYGINLLRFSTKDSGEREKIAAALQCSKDI